ncbi:MAG: hypothetical protein JZU55_05250 [Afipia sp.]|nr:hypothetical protein [Afipia sp.]
MTVAQLLEALSKMPKEAVVLIEAGGGLSRVDALDFVEDQGPGAPAEVILLPSMDARIRLPACSSPVPDPQLLRGVLSGRRAWISDNLEKNDV